MSHVARTAVFALSALASVQAKVTTYRFDSHDLVLPEGGKLVIEAAPDPPKALPESAPSSAINLQPVLDYDTDSCYNVPAIDAEGNCAAGLTADYTTLTGDCREASNLDNQNVYVRSRCNNGWCAYMYEHYFEKDVALEYVAGLGHRHEWENIVIVTKQGEDVAQFIAASQHDGYQTKAAADVRFLDSHSKNVYHKDGASTHDFRFANEDDDNIENDKGTWIRGALIDWNMWPSTELRDKMIANWASTGIKCKLADDQFGNYLSKAIGDRCPGFDVNSDS